MAENLHVQEYLHQHDYTDLLTEFGIEHRKNKNYPLVILDYNMYLIPPGKKDHPIVRECRGITLDTRDHSLVAKSFDRFFNYGELKNDPFDFSDFVVQTKEDGSLIKIYYFENHWHINTRFSFGDGLCCDSDMTWENIVLKTLELDAVTDFDKYLNRGLTYVCELCSPWNCVVREYPEPVLFLLSIFDGAHEFSLEECDKENNGLFQRPCVYSFKSVDEILKFLDFQEENDPSFEGFVLRDRLNNHLKIKSKSYMRLSYYFGNGTAFHPRHLIVLVHDGDVDEILTYYPNVRPAFDDVKKKVESHIELLWNLYTQNSQKDKRSFHESVAGVTLHSVLETLHKQKGTDATREELFQIWIQNEDKVLRELFGVTASEHNLRHRSNYQTMRERNRRNKEN